MFDTHLFGLLKLIKTILYPQTFNQKQSQKYFQLILSLINPLQTNQQQPKEKGTSCNESSFLSSMLQKYDKNSIEC
ncbi:unnamed protein product [Adineta steineri]|uniref:Uncharacterized protein n=1 Tax=Adineta steineri TaxID=433720 RepID=A0A819ZR69_9BILA|nr:unnamed protein product [Adineta steineri]CAF4202735.1 unnamed protein product [Adineta steineri]